MRIISEREKKKTFYIGTTIEKELDNFISTGVASDGKRCVAVTIAAVYVSLKHVDEELDHVEVALIRCNVERRLVACILRFDSSAQSQQEINHFHIAVAHAA